MARILVIDDDQDVRAVILCELESAGHDVVGAAHGAQGLQLQRASPADVVETDILMPEKEGIETIRELPQEFPRAKIIAITGGGSLRPGRRSFTAHDLEVVGVELAVSAILHKPFDAGELLRSVDRALNGGSAER
jgi:CheY-like chemotaxis protein